MKIDGKVIADEIKKDLNKRIGNLIAHGITPKIAVITLGDESSWESYVRQKLKVADQLGIKAILINLADSNEETLLNTINEIDNDSKYHGIIVQRPMPDKISRDKVISAISPEKDIDGFRPDSKFEVPVWLAVKHIINSIKGGTDPYTRLKYVIIGKGETAGRPIVNGLHDLGIEATIIDSKTEHPEQILKNADVVISAVGKSRVVQPEFLKKGVILIGVGTHDEDGKIRGDYVDTEIENIAGDFTPTPGGVGPVNLSYLFSNLVTAAENSMHKHQ